MPSARIELDIHGELHRLILRSRWIRWSLRNYQPGDYEMPCGRHTILSRRLTEFAPTFAERQKDDEDRWELI